jgi:hypothetical protein
MARTRTISQNIALLVSSGVSTGAHGSNLYSIWGLQSLDYSWSNPKQDVQVYGLGAPISRETIESPEVSLNFSYLATSANNEYRLGLETLNGATSVLTRLLNNTADDKNYFIFVAPDGQDAVGLSGGSSGIGIIGIGNGFISSYSIEGAVGGFPTASVSVQGLNIKTYTNGTTQPIPAVSPTTGLEIGNTGTYNFTVPTITNHYINGMGGDTVPAVLRPGDISLTLTNAGGLFHDYTSPCVQSFNISFDLNRQPINCLGYRFAASRSIQFPINVNFEVEMLAKDIKTGSLADFLCRTGTYSAQISMKLPDCAGAGAEQIGIRMLNLSLEGQQWSTSVGGEPQTVRTSWIGQVGGATDTTNGFFMSGAVTGVAGSV